MRVVRLKEFWCTKDSNLVINDKITEIGMTAYWNAIDATFSFNESRREVFLAKNICSKDSNTLVVGVSNKIPAAKHEYDPMKDFFRRNRNVEYRMDTHEDRLSRRSYEEPHMGVGEDRRFQGFQPRRRQNNRFLLPHLHNRF